MNDLPVRLAQGQVIADLLKLCRVNELVIRDKPLVEEANYDNIVWLLEQAQERNLSVPVDKTGRWIGFVQCSLIVRGVLDTKTERDQTRALFHAAYEQTGQAIPPTINRTTS